MSKIKTKKLIDVINYFDIDIDFLNENYERIELPECETEEEEWKQYEKAKTTSDIVAVHCFERDRHITYFLGNKENFVDVMPGKDEKLSFKELITVVNIIMKQIMTDKRTSYNVSIGYETDEEYTVYAQESTIFGVWWNYLFKMFTSHLSITNEIFVKIDGSDIIVSLCK